MRITPGVDSAVEVSSLRMRPFPIVLLTGTAKTMLGKLWSEEYFAVPLVFSGPSIRGTALPIIDAAAEVGVAGMQALLMP
jgi:hypothetical protein